MLRAMTVRSRCVSNCRELGYVCMGERMRRLTENGWNANSCSWERPDGKVMGTL
jgi:hypothetical protein